MQLVADRQMRSAARSLLAPGDVLPAASLRNRWSPLATSSVPSSSDHPVSGLDGLPVCEHLRPDVAPIGTAPLGSVDRVADPQIGERARARPSAMQDRRVARRAIDAGMRAAPVRVDRPPERHPRSLGHAVQRGLRLDLVEARLQGLGRIEVCGRPPASRTRADGSARPLRLSGSPTARTHVRIRERRTRHPSRCTRASSCRPSSRLLTAGPLAILRRHPARTRGHGRPRDQSRRALTADARAGRPLHAHRSRVVLSRFWAAFFIGLGLMGGMSGFD